jgi:hypothetical protein
MPVGIRVEYYNRPERGNATGASDEVLEDISRVHRPDEAECAR